MNKVNLLGRLTRDPEIRYSQGNDQMAIARYTLAVDRRFKRDGEQTADFISCVAFGKAAASGENEQPASCDPQGFMSIPDGIEDDLPFK